jgi:hypothetical protein
MHHRTVHLCSIAGFLVCIDVPDDVIRETYNLVASSLGHFGKAFSLRLILKCVCWEIDS